MVHSSYKMMCYSEQYYWSAHLHVRYWL